jgi:alpha-soluble NSF attachment protein
MGDKFIVEANAALKRTTIFGFGKTAKFEDAAAAFTKAGNAFKMSKQWTEAGEAFIKCAECQKNLDSDSDVCNSYVEAGSCFKKSDNPMDAVAPLEQAIESYTERGRLSQVARILKDIAEIFEKSREIDQAVEYYQRAADAAEADNKKQDKLKSLLKIATLCSTDHGGGDVDYLKAADLFEAMGHEGMESKLGAYAAKGYFFQAALCLMASGDNVAATNKLKSFKQADFNFPSSRECQFVESLLEAMENFNGEDFAQACADFDRITPLDPWKTSVLVKIKRHLTQAEAEENEDDLT